MNDLNVLSLFAGIGGLELGLERSGMTVVGQVELNPFCRSILAKHWPDVPRHDDVRTTVKWWESEKRPYVDLVCGGIPCQPFSTAGQQGGIADERWGWPWMRTVIDAVRPGYVLIENVAALLRSAEAFSIILSDLSDLGFGVEWDVVSACSVGAPHTRERVFIVAYAESVGRQRGRGVGPETEPMELEGCGQELGRPWTASPRPFGVAYGLPGRVDRLTALGNAVVPQVAERVGRLLMGAGV